MFWLVIHFSCENVASMLYTIRSGHAMPLYNVCTLSTCTFPEEEIVNIIFSSTDTLVLLYSFYFG